MTISAALLIAQKEALIDTQSHREAWRAALTICLTRSVNDVDGDRGAYWQHEIAAFDRTFYALESLAQAASQPVEGQAPRAGEPKLAYAELEGAWSTFLADMQMRARLRGEEDLDISQGKLMAMQLAVGKLLQARSRQPEQVSEPAKSEVCPECGGTLSSQHGDDLVCFGEGDTPDAGCGYKNSAWIIQDRKMAKTYWLIEKGSPALYLMEYDALSDPSHRFEKWAEDPTKGIRWTEYGAKNLAGKMEGWGMSDGPFRACEHMDCSQPDTSQAPHPAPALPADWMMVPTRKMMDAALLARRNVAEDEHPRVVVKLMLQAAFAAAPASQQPLPADWVILEKETCFVILRDNEVIASLAGPRAKENAKIIISCLARSQPGFYSKFCNMQGGGENSKEPPGGHNKDLGNPVGSHAEREYVSPMKKSADALKEKAQSEREVFEQSLKGEKEK